MNVTLSPVAPRYAVSHAEDPFKKYWWAILMGFGVTALWLLLPMMGEKSVGSASVDLSKKADAPAEQSLGGADEGDGSLSMDGARRKKKDEGLVGSMLYQPMPGEGLEGDPAAAATAGSKVGLGSASGGTLASALKKVSDGSTGWGGEKAQRGFNQPKLAGGSLSGMGSASGGSAGSASSGMSGFGSKNANVGYGNTKSVADAGDPSAAASKGIAALRGAAAAAQAAAANRSNDGAANGAGRAFDGSRGGNSIGAGAGGVALGSTYEALDAAPANLKASDPKLNDKKIEPPAGTNLAQSDMDNSAFAKQLAMMMVGIVVGGVIGGPAGGIVTSVIQKAVEAQEENERKKRELNDKIQLENAKSRIH